jgi:hypothetical protein
MKQQLYINQINYFLTETKRKIILLEEDKTKDDKREHTELSYRNSKSRLNGVFQALSLNQKEDIHTQIMNNIAMFNKASNDLKNKVNYLDDNDKNFTLFYLIGGALDISMILLTIYDNPQSCCPINKDIIFKNTMANIDKQIEEAIKAKDNKQAKELNKELAIINKQYQDNMKLL